MENVRGKEVDLSRATVKIPGQYRPGRGAITSNGLLKSHLHDLSAANARAGSQTTGNSSGPAASESGTMNARRSGGSTSSGVVGGATGGQDGAVILSNDSMAQGALLVIEIRSGCKLNSFIHVC